MPKVKWSKPRGRMAEVAEQLADVFRAVEISDDGVRVFSQTGNPLFGVRGLSCEGRFRVDEFSRMALHAWADEMRLRREEYDARNAATAGD